MDIRRPEKIAETQHRHGYKLLLIGQPITGSFIHKKTYASALGILSPLSMIDLLEKHKITSCLRIINDFPIDYNRNRFVDDAIAMKADYLMFMDMDMTFPPNMLNNLFELISDENPVVAGMYFLKKPPFSPVMGRYVDWTDELWKNREHLMKQGFWMDDSTPKGKQLLMWRSITFFDKDGGPFEVDVIGMGCVLIKTEVFKKLQRPFFRYSYDPEKGDEAHQKLSEDMYFCAQLKKAGIPILIDPRVQCGHLTEMEVNADIYASQRETCIDIWKTKDPAAYQKMLNEAIDVREEQKENSNGREAESVKSA